MRRCIGEYLYGQTHYGVWFACCGIFTERKSTHCASSHYAFYSLWGPGQSRPRTGGPRQFQGPGSRPTGARGCVGPVPEIPRLWALHWEPCQACGATPLPIGFWFGGSRPWHQSHLTYLQEGCNLSGEEAYPQLPQVILGWWPGNPWSCRPCDTRRSYRVSGRPRSSRSKDRLQNSRPAEPQRQYCVGAGLYRPCCCKFGWWPPVSPVQSRLDREALGAQTFCLQPPGGSFGTNRSRHHCLLLPFLGVGQLGPLRWFASHLCLRRPVYCPGWRWMSFHPGSRWMSFHPGSRWTFSCPNQRLVGFHPDAFWRLQLLGSQFGSTSVGEVVCLVGPQVLWVLVALGGEGRPEAGPTVPVSSDSSLRAYPSCEVIETF